jgi:ATP-dependent Zn protease
MLAFACAANACAEQNALPDASDVLKVSNTVFSYSQEEGRNVITTIGAIQNTSQARAEELVVEVRYFDRNKILIDSVTQPMYGVVVPPGQQLSFRVRDAADKPKSAYATSVARVVSAEQRTPSKPQSKGNLSFLTDILISWAPMLLLIGVWIYFMKKMSRKDSPQKRTIELIQEQNLTLARQLEVLERLAVAAEKAASK